MARRGQATLEYALLISAVVGAAVAMFPYTMDSLRAYLKITEEGINEAVLRPDHVKTTCSGLICPEVPADIGGVIGAFSGIYEANEHFEYYYYWNILFSFVFPAQVTVSILMPDGNMLPSGFLGNLNPQTYTVAKDEVKTKIFYYGRKYRDHMLHDYQYEYVVSGTYAFKFTVTDLGTGSTYEIEYKLNVTH